MDGGYHDAGGGGSQPADRTQDSSRRRPRDRARALRVLHPFPSLLDAAVVTAIAVVAGASPGRVLLLAAAMLVLQLAIGAANDWADAPADATAQPGKPIPAGLVARRTAGVMAIVLATAGLLLAATAGILALATAAGGLAAGLAYDLRLKGTRWSWLPYAVGIPLLPAFAWAGATGELPAALGILVPVAAIAGAGLAIANALADLEHDRAAGIDTIATALGPTRARAVGAGLMAAAAGAALATALAFGGVTPWFFLAAAGGGVVVAGIAAGWRGEPAARRRAWEIQAIGAGILATGWIGALVAGAPTG